VAPTTEPEIDPAGEPAGPARSPPDEASFPLPRLARITAAIDREPHRATEILAASDVDEDQWDALEALARTQVVAGTRTGDPSVLARFDDVYLETLEDDRGPIELDDYARMVVAEERGEVDPLARELDLPAPALMRLARVWQRRAAADPAIAHELRGAIKRWRAR
jgi:hypothetical protein